MIDISDVCKYFSMTTHKANNNYDGAQVHSIIKIVGTKCLNKYTAPEIKAGFVLYFGNEPFKEYNCTRHALDLSDIVGIDKDNKAIDSSGISAILVFNRLSKNYGHGEIALINCQPEVKRLMKITELDTLFGMVKDKSELK